MNICNNDIKISSYDRKLTDDEINDINNKSVKFKSDVNNNNYLIYQLKQVTRSEIRQGLSSDPFAGAPRSMIRFSEFS